MIRQQPPQVAPPPVVAPRMPDMQSRRTVPASSAEIARAATPFQPTGLGAVAPPPSKPVAPRIDTGTAPAGRSELEKVMQAIRAKEQAAGGSPLGRTEYFPQGALPPTQGGAPGTVVLPDAPTNIPGLMPLAEYARITATLTREGDPPATFRRLGIDAVAWMTTVRAYSAKFAEDPSLEVTFRKLVEDASRHR